MPKINREEYELLKNLDDKWKWIARDKSIRLYIFEEEPHRIGTIWMWVNDTDANSVDGDLFQFVQWPDEEPYNIAALIEEYEQALKEAIELFIKAASRTVKTMGDSLQRIGKAFSSVIVPNFTIDDIEHSLANESKEAEVKKVVNLSVNFDRGLETYPKMSVDEAIETLTDYGTKYLVIEKEPKTYRFTQNAFMEQDFKAHSFEEAEKQAQAEWKRMFEYEGLFGSPEFEKEVGE